VIASVGRHFPLDAPPSHVQRVNRLCDPGTQSAWVHFIGPGEVVEKTPCDKLSEEYQASTSVSVQHAREQACRHRRSRNGLAARRARARARAMHRTCCAPQAKRTSCANHKPAVAANQAHFQCKRSAGACEHRQTRTDRAEPRPSRRLAWTDSQARRRLPVLVRAAAIAQAGRLTRARGRTARRTGRWRRRRGSGRRTRRTAPPAARPARAQSPCPC